MPRGIDKTVEGLKLGQGSQPVTVGVSGGKLGFFGTAPVVKPTVDTSGDTASDVASVIAALVALGLVTEA
jgi:hypothetical protein